MKRYQLRQLYTLNEFNNLGKQMARDYNAVAMNPDTAGQYDETINFIMSSIYGYFYEDLVTYFGETKASVRGKLYHRLGLDLAIKLPYWYKKYKQIKKLLTTEDLSLMQTSKMTSTSSDNTDSASGTLQKTATTPTGVSTGTATDGFDININDGADSVETTGFADKYTNAQQKFANASKVTGTRNSEILREGSIDDLLKVLEKLPSSFADEVLKDMQKHFIYDYDGELKGLYNFTEGDFGMGIIIGKTRTNQPVEEVEGFEDAVKVVLDDDVNLGGDVAVEGDLTVSGDAVIFENITDADGHQRFIEGDVTSLLSDSITTKYAKWSLSGTHLMIVFAFENTSGSDVTLAQWDKLFEINDLPEWVMNKIVGIVTGDNLVTTGDLYPFGATAQAVITRDVYLNKQSTTKLTCPSAVAIPFYNGNAYRIQYDLVID